MVDERDLLLQARELDEVALSTIFDTYYEPLYRYIYHQIRHAATAEDLTAEAFSRFLQAIRAGRGPERMLKAWLYRVARNLVIDETRRFKHRNHAQLDEQQADTATDVPAQAQQAILYEQALNALSGLTSKQRDVIVLKYLEGLQNDEIAEILEIRVGAVKSLQNRGLAAMQRQLIAAGAVIEEQA